MTRRGFLGMSAAATPQLLKGDEFENNLADHYNSLLAFVRKYYGCEPDAVDMATCKPHKAQIDRSGFSRACKTAMRLFQLKD
jgi:hypothetical protein